MPYIPEYLLESSLIWGGTTIGDAQDYGSVEDDLFMYYLNSMGGNGLPRRYGVLYTNHASYSGCLAPTNPAGTTLRVANGVALGWRYFYRNTANVDFSCSAIGYYHIVLRSWRSGQTVRLMRLGHDTRRYPPALRTNSYNDLSIALVYSNGATLTITDTRRFFRNIVFGTHTGDDEQWEDNDSTTITSPHHPLAVLMQCGSHLSDIPAGAHSISSMPKVGGNFYPLVLLQAQGNYDTPGATKMTFTVATETGSFPTYQALDYYIDSDNNMGSVYWLSFQPLDGRIQYLPD